MIKPIAKQQTMDDGLTPPCTVRDELYLVDEVSAYLIDKYHVKQQIQAMGYSPVKALKVQVSEEVRRANPALLYGEQIQLLDVEPPNVFNHMQTMINRLSPEQLVNVKRQQEFNRECMGTWLPSGLNGSDTND